MAFTLADRSVTRVAVIGSGNIGPDVALHFARSLTRYSVPVVVHDVSREALDLGRKRLLEKIQRGSVSSVFRPLDLELLDKNVTFTQDRSMLMGCDFVIE